MGDHPIIPEAHYPSASTPLSLTFFNTFFDDINSAFTKIAGVTLTPETIGYTLYEEDIINRTIAFSPISLVFKYPTSNIASIVMKYSSLISATSDFLFDTMDIDYIDSVSGLATTLVGDYDSINKQFSETLEVSAETSVGTSLTLTIAPVTRTIEEFPVSDTFGFFVLDLTLDDGTITRSIIPIVKLSSDSNAIDGKLILLTPSPTTGSSVIVKPIVDWPARIPYDSRYYKWYVNGTGESPMTSEDSESSKTFDGSIFSYYGSYLVTCYMCDATGEPYATALNPLALTVKTSAEDFRPFYLDASGQIWDTNDEILAEALAYNTTPSTGEYPGVVVNLYSGTGELSGNDAFETISECEAIVSPIRFPHFASGESYYYSTFDPDYHTLTIFSYIKDGIYNYQVPAQISIVYTYGTPGV